jgi:choline-sulfatase
MIDRRSQPTTSIAVLLCILAFTGCREFPDRVTPVDTGPLPSILLVTLDTTRADAIGPDAEGVETPAFNELATRGRRFTQAYATAPQTLPSHSSMMTGLYPGGHGVHENARFLDAREPLLAERLKDRGYTTAAFVSAYPLARRFGLARGFDLYDDDLGEGMAERSARETNERVLAWLRESDQQPLFLWVHYFDPHYPYEPPEPFRSRFADDPYRGEVAAMDHEMGRLLEAFQRAVQGPAAIIVAADHGEALGDHGEAQHGNLLYQGVMHVPLVVAGPGVEPGISNAPVSIRRIFHTILDWAGLGDDSSLRGETPEIVMGEAMQPFLQYGWQPQVMAVEGPQKVIHAGTIEVYDVIADPAESRDLGDDASPSRELRQALRDYPIPSLTAARPPENLSDEERRQLASLGYISSDTRPVVRSDAPRPRDMTHLFDDLDKASGLFVAEEYARAIPIFERILDEDPDNLGILLQLAAAHSALGQQQPALAAFERARAVAPDSPDVRHYLALHYARSGEWDRATPLLEQDLAETPNRLTAIEALATARERQGRLDEAITLRQRAHTMKTPSAADLIRLGELAMNRGQTPLALASFEQARERQGAEFRHDLELGVLYLDDRRFDDARRALDRVPPSHPAYPMALFKRAQVSVLLGEPDQAQRIARAREHADPTTRTLIERERLFRN